MPHAGLLTEPNGSNRSEFQNGSVAAIAAVAPVIGADGEDFAASIAFTAVLGVMVVLLLPLAAPLLHLSELQYGALAGMTVYAVPQALAATAPVGTAAVQSGTLVELVRVLMLGPVVLGLSLLTRRLRDEPDEAAPHVMAGNRQAPRHTTSMFQPIIAGYVFFLQPRRCWLSWKQIDRPHARLTTE